jgi:hypothetical protein
MRNSYAEVYKSGTDSVVAGTGSLKDGQASGRGSHETHPLVLPMYFL